MHYSTNTADMGVGVTTRTVLRWNSCLSKIWLYAGITEYPVGTSAVASSDNPSAAVNQQERLIKIG
jgi:hypothetical protein